MSGSGPGGSANHAGTSGAGTSPGNGGAGAIGNGGTAGAAHSLMVPCDVSAVFANVCQNCHSEPPTNDAPFALVSYQNIKSEAAAIDGAVSTGQMPKAPYSLSVAEKMTLLSWIEAGAHGVPVAACP